MQRKLYPTFLSIAVVLAAGPLRAEEPVSVEFLRAALQSQLDSIRSITATFTISQRPLKKNKYLSQAEPWGPVKYEWAAKAPKEFLYIDPSNGQQRPYTASFDGRLGYTVSHPENQTEVAHADIRRESPDTFEARYVPTDAIGARVPLARVPLATIMADKSCRLEGREEIDGVSCWKVSAEATDRLAGTPILVTAFFDPAHDYLPRQIEVRRKDFKIPDWHLTWAVTEFHKLPDDKLPLRWLPRVAEFRQLASIQTLTVTQMVVNPSIPDRKFTPDLSGGAMITDHTGPGGPQIYAWGNVHRQVEQITAAALVAEMPQPAASDLPPAAVPPQGGVWWTVLLAVSVALLAVGLALFMRR